MGLVTAANWIALIAFYLGLFYFFYKHRKEVDRQWGIIFIYRTKKGLKFIKNLASKFRRFWIVYGYVGIPVVFLLMFGMVVMLVVSIIDMFAAPEAAAPVAGIVVPWVSTGVHGAVITVSIWYFLIAVIVTLLVHEGAHAVIAVAHKLRLKAAGVGLFAVVPLAFVEPDEKQIGKAKAKRQLAIFAAGPFTNIVTAIVIILLAFFLVLPSLASSTQINGFEINELDVTLPAGLSELKEGDIITRIDNTSFVSQQATKKFALATTYESALGLPQSKLDAFSTEPNQTVEIETASGKVVELTAETTTDEPTAMGALALRLGLIDKERFEPRGVLGFKSLSYAMESKPGSSAAKLLILGTLYVILAWVGIFNIGIGLFNTLPIGPLDGGRMMRTVIESVFKRKKKVGLKVFMLISTLVLIVLLFGIFGAYLIR